MIPIRYTHLPVINAGITVHISVLWAAIALAESSRGHRSFHDETVEVPDVYISLFIGPV